MSSKADIRVLNTSQNLIYSKPQQRNSTPSRQPRFAITEGSRLRFLCTPCWQQPRQIAFPNSPTGKREIAMDA
jgi:hypothetical protein